MYKYCRKTALLWTTFRVLLVIGKLWFEFYLRIVFGWGGVEEMQQNQVIFFSRMCGKYAFSVGKYASLKILNFFFV